MISTVERSLRCISFALLVGWFAAGMEAADSGTELFSIVSMTLDDEALNRAHDVELKGDLAFVPGKGGSTAILDISDLKKPEILWHLADENVTPDSETVLPAGNHLLLGTRNFHVLDVSRPKQTRIVKTISDLPQIDKINGMVLVEDVVIAACKSGFLSAFDISDIAEPEVFGVLETKKAYGLEKPHDIDRFGDYLVVVDPQGFAPPIGRLGVIRAMEGQAVLPIKQWKLVGIVDGEELIGANRVQVIGNFAFVGGSMTPTAQTKGASPKLAVVDLSDPGEPKVVNSVPFDSLRGPNGLTVAGDVVFCAGGQRVEAYDVSDPRNPKSLGGQNFPIYQQAEKTDNYHDLVYRDGHLYVSAQSDNGFLILRVEDEKIRELAERDRKGSR